MHRQSHKTGFTLIELLIVISLAALLMMFTVPAFLDIGRGSKMEAAVNQLNTTLNLARQWAITKRERVYILFPDDHSNLYSGLGTNHNSKALRSYVAYVPNKGYITEWRFLPGGIYFVDSYNTPNLNNKNIYKNKIDEDNNLFRANTLEGMPFPTAQSGNKQINVLVFEPDGRTKAHDLAPTEVYLSEAIALEGSGGKVINLVWKENSVLRGLAINKWTGSTRILDFAQITDP